MIKKHIALSIKSKFLKLCHTNYVFLLSGTVWHAIVHEIWKSPGFCLIDNTCSVKKSFYFINNNFKSPSTIILLPFLPLMWTEMIRNFEWDHQTKLSVLVILMAPWLHDCSETIIRALKTFTKTIAIKKEWNYADIENIRIF
jgi:hypothetical protein